MGLLDMPLVSEMVERDNRNHLEARANKLLKRKVRRGKRKKHKRKVPKMSYKQYMGSAYWKKRKLVYWSRYGKSCAICMETQGVTLHHKRYDVKYGEEPDTALVALCPFHHQGFHENYPLAANMVKNTDRYVSDGRVTHQQMAESGINDLSWI